MQPDVAALLPRGVALRLQAGLVAAGDIEGRLRGRHLCTGRLTHLQLRIDHTRANEVLPAQVDVAPGIAIGQRCAALRIADLRDRNRDGTLRARCRCRGRDNPGIQVDRVHLGNKLAGTNVVTNVHKHTIHAARDGGTDQVGAPGLHHANAEDRRFE